MQMHIVKATVIALSVIFDRGLATPHQHGIFASVPRTVATMTICETHGLLVGSNTKLTLLALNNDLAVTTQHFVQDEWQRKKQRQ